MFEKLSVSLVFALPFFFCIRRSSAEDASSWRVHPRLRPWSLQLELELPKCQFLDLTRHRSLAEPGTPFPDHLSSSLDRKLVPASNFAFDLHIKVENRGVQDSQQAPSPSCRHAMIGWLANRSDHLRMLRCSTISISGKNLATFLRSYSQKSLSISPQLVVTPKSPPKASRKSSLR